MSLPARTLLALLLVLFAFILLTALRDRAPAPLEPRAPGVFSAYRAAEILDSLYVDGVPHPVGTVENEEMRDNILFRIRAMGIEPLVQRAFVCGAYATCANVENILFRIEGREDGKGVLLAAHYDSVPAGPGVSDDGVAVAILLEIARVLRGSTPPRNDVTFLIGDGEEAGLLGAETFVTGHAWVREIGAVVNLEARGTSGRSFLFETSEGHGWMIELAAQALKRPASTSLFDAIYRRLPNDTDFTVFRRAGLEGVNFAFIGDPAHYHTPLDDLRHASPRSLQHHGENAMAMVNAFANFNLDHPEERRDRVWFDVFGFGIFSWPASWSLPLAILGLLLSAGCAALFRFDRRIRLRSLAVALLWWPLSLLLAGGAMLLLVRIGQWLGAFPAPWLAYPQPLLAAAWVAALAVPAGLTVAIRRFLDQRTAWAAILIWLSLLGIVSAILLTGASYLFIVPVLISAPVAILVLARGGDSAVRDLLILLLPLAGASIVILPVAWSLYVAMGVPAIPGVTILAGMVISILLPAMIELQPDLRTLRYGIPSLLLLVVVLVIVAAILPPYTDESPQRVNVTYHLDADRGEARWLVRRDIPEAMERIGQWEDALFEPFPWLQPSPLLRSARAKVLPLTPPELLLTEGQVRDGKRSLSLHLRPGRAADRIEMVVHDPGVESFAINGKEIPLAALQKKGRLTPGDLSVTIARPAVQTHIEMVLSHDREVEVTLLERTFGLPDSVDLIAARPSHA
ncbi:MAG TPA: M28 family peptidase, partial [Thermoanaerobaculia bacterium]|nr:M28 family peptidase [Thermoanaerobaculia bacterium]